MRQPDFRVLLTVFLFLHDLNADLDSFLWRRLTLHHANSLYQLAKMNILRC